MVGLRLRWYEYFWLWWFVAESSPQGSSLLRQNSTSEPFCFAFDLGFFHSPKFDTYLPVE